MSVQFKWNNSTKQKILNQPPKTMYAIARQLLDMTLPTIPMKSGTMRKTSMSAGVRSTGKKYYIGSFTNYAKAVYSMSDNTNWTTPGTNNKWFDKMWKLKKSIILNTVEKQERLK